MTQKDYILLADAINRAYRYEDTEDGKLALKNFVGILRTALKSDNYQFDGDKFWNRAFRDES